MFYEARKDRGGRLDYIRRHVRVSNVLFSHIPGRVKLSARLCAQITGDSAM